MNSFMSRVSKRLSKRYAAAAMLLAAGLMLSGCGDDAKAPPAAPASAPAPVAPSQPPPEMLSLVPDGAAGFVYARNLKSLESSAKRIATAVDPKSAAGIHLAELVGGLVGVDAADLDMAQGALLVITVGAASQPPGITAILGVHDAPAVAAQIAAQMPGVPTEVAGSFIAVTPSRAYHRAGRMPGWADGALPAGDVVARFDVAAIMRTQGATALASAKEAIAGIAGTMPHDAGQPDPTAVLSAALDGIVSALDEVSVEDMALRIDGTAIELDALQRWKDPQASRARSPFKTVDLTSLARGVNDAAVSMAVGMDQQRMMAMVRPILSTLSQTPAPVGGANLMKAFERWQEASRFIGPGMVMSAGFAPAGFQLVALAQSTDVKAYRAAVADSVGRTAEDTSGYMKATAEEARVVDGTTFSAWRMELDETKSPASRLAGAAADAQRAISSALLGDHGMEYRMADLGDRVLTTCGLDDAAVARALRATKRTAADPATELALAVSAAGPDTVALLRIECRALARSVAATVAHITGTETRPSIVVPAGDSVPITVIVNMPSDGVRMRVAYDVGKLAALVKACMPK